MMNAQTLPLKRNHRRNYSLTTIVVLIIASIITLEGCTKKQAEELTPDPGGENETVTTANVSYDNFVKALFETNCGSCHGNGRPASARWAFSGYTSVKDNIEKINNAVLITKSMPIGRSLTMKELELLDAWIKRNTPEK